MNAGKELSRLTSKILTGEMRYADVEEALNRISMQYGEDCFNSFPVERKEKPWSDKDLEDLGTLSACGAGSREFYLYMAEVSDYVYSQKAAKRKTIRRVLTFLAIVLAIAIAIFVIEKYNRQLLSVSNSNLQLEDAENTDGLDLIQSK